MLPSRKRSLPGPSLTDSVIALGRASSDQWAEFGFAPSEISAARDVLSKMAGKLLSKRVSEEVASEIEQLGRNACPDVTRIDGDPLKFLHDREPDLIMLISVYGNGLEVFPALASWVRPALVDRMADMTRRYPWTTMLRGCAAMRLRWARLLEGLHLKTQSLDESSFWHPLTGMPVQWSLHDEPFTEHERRENFDRFNYLQMGQTLVDRATTDPLYCEALSVYEAAALVVYSEDSYARRTMLDQRPIVGGGVDGCVAEELNKRLRSMKGPDDDIWFDITWAPLMRSLMTAAYKLSRHNSTRFARETLWTPGRGSLWRAVHCTDLREFGHVEGAIVRWSAFSSASSSRQAAEHYGLDEWKGGRGTSIALPDGGGLHREGQFHTLCRIDDVVSAVDITPYTILAGVEALREVLILPGVRLQVVTVHEQTFGPRASQGLFIHLREVTP